MRSRRCGTLAAMRGVGVFLCRLIAAACAAGLLAVPAEAGGAYREGGGQAGFPGTIPDVDAAFRS